MNFEWQINFCITPRFVTSPYRLSRRPPVRHYLEAASNLQHMRCYRLITNVSIARRGTWGKNAKRFSFLEEFLFQLWENQLESWIKIVMTHVASRVLLDSSTLIGHPIFASVWIKTNRAFLLMFTDYYLLETYLSSLLIKKHDNISEARSRAWVIYLKHS